MPQCPKWNGCPVLVANVLGSLKVKAVRLMFLACLLHRANGE